MLRLKFLRWWRAFFPPTPESLLKSADLGRLKFLSLSLSSHAYEEFLPNVQLELEEAKHWSLKFGLQRKLARWDLWENREWSAGKLVPSKAGQFASLWLFSHASVNEAFAPLKERSLTPVLGQTATSLQSEGRGLQWLQATFKVLEGALASCKKNPDQLVIAQFQFDAGKLRLQCFNLDLTVVFRDDQSMAVVVFDDKNHGAGSAQTPSLEAEFATLKPAVLDELIKISAAILGAAEARFLE